MSGGWLLAHGGAEGYLGQNVLVQTEQNGSTSHNSQVLTTFISTVEMPKDMVALAKATLSSFMESHGAPKVTSVEASSTSTPSDHDQKSVSGWQPCNEVEHRIPPHDCHLPFPNVFHNKVLGAMAETLYACRGFAFQHREMNKMNDLVVQPKQCGATFQSFRRWASRNYTLHITENYLNLSSSQKLEVSDRMWICLDGGFSKFKLQGAYRHCLNRWVSFIGSFFPKSD